MNIEVLDNVLKFLQMEDGPVAAQGEACGFCADCEEVVLRFDGAFVALYGRF